MKNWSRLALVAAIAGSLVISLLSDQIDDYALNILILIGINIILAVSLNLVNGHTGQFSLGHAGFMAVGAYVSSAVTMFAGPSILKILGGGAFGVSVLFPLALAIGGGAAAFTGLLVGVPSLRLRGDYLAIVTLGFGEIIRVVIQNTDAVGGPRGIGGIPPYTSFFWTYALMQMPAGYLIDRFGPRPMYSIAVGWWSGRLSSDGVPWGKGGCAPLHTRLSPVSTFEAAKYDYNFIGTYGTGSTSIMVSSMLSRTL